MDVLVKVLHRESPVLITAHRAQDILSAEYKYDAAANQIVYTMTVKDLSTANANMHWIQEVNFKNPADPNAPARSVLADDEE